MRAELTPCFVLKTKLEIVVDRINFHDLGSKWYVLISLKKKESHTHTQFNSFMYMTNKSFSLLATYEIALHYQAVFNIMCCIIVDSWVLVFVNQSDLHDYLFISFSYNLSLLYYISNISHLD